MNTKTFKKVLTLIGIPALLCGALTAQDAMTFKNGDVFKVKVDNSSEFDISKNDISKTYRIDESKIVVVWNGASEVFNPISLEEKNHLNFKKNMIYIKKNVQIKIIFQ